jgi:hypothetical protein
MLRPRFLHEIRATSAAARTIIRRTLHPLSATQSRLANDPPAQPLECSQIVRHPSYAPRLHLRVHHSAIPAT